MRSTGSQACFTWKGALARFEDRCKCECVPKYLRVTLLPGVVSLNACFGALQHSLALLEKIQVAIYVLIY